MPRSEEGREGVWGGRDGGGKGRGVERSHEAWGDRTRRSHEAWRERVGLLHWLLKKDCIKAEKEAYKHLSQLRHDEGGA